MIIIINDLYKGRPRSLRVPAKKIKGPQVDYFL